MWFSLMNMLGQMRYTTQRKAAIKKLIFRVVHIKLNNSSYSKFDIAGKIKFFELFNILMLKQFICVS